MPSLTCINSGDQGGLWAMCPVSWLSFKGDQQSYHWLELSPLHPQQVQIEICNQWCPYCGFYTHSVFGQKENDASLNWHIILSQACKVFLPAPLGKYLPQIITGLKHQLPRENRMVILDIWNLEPVVNRNTTLYAVRGSGLPREMYFIQPQAWPLRALKGLTYSKVHYWPLH